MRYYTFIIILFLAFFSVSSFSSEKEDIPPITKLYNQLKLKYNSDFSKGNFVSSYVISTELISMDPSDAYSYLMLAITARELNLDTKDIKNNISSSIGEGNQNSIDLKLLSDALLTAPKKNNNNPKEIRRKIKELGDFYRNKINNWDGSGDVSFQQ